MLKENKIYKFLEQVKQETCKVVWPDKKELITLTLLVLVVVFVFSMVCLALDYGIHSVVQKLLSIGR